MGYQTLTEATRFTGTWVDFGVARKAWGYDADQRPSTHPVAPDAVPDTASALLNFDGISYAKGASALRQLVAWLGEKDFLAGINTHFRRHKFANATLADFIASLAHHTDRDVHAWADTWLRTTGVDTLTATVTEHPGQTALTLTRDGSRPHRVTVGVYDRDLIDGATLVRRELTDLDIPAAPPTANTASPAPAPPSSSPTTRTSPTPRSASTPTRRKPPCAPSRASPTPLTRAVLWNCLRDMVRDGELEPLTYLEAARAHLPGERELANVQGVLAFARTQIADRYTTPTERPDALALLTDLCTDLIRRTEDGSNPGLRLTAVRTLIDSAAHADTIRDWYDSGSVPGGPELDPELRWRILGRLCVLGAVDDAVIEAELTQDPSATGRQGAALCRAALPDPEAKRAAWDAMFTTDELSNYLFNATAQGFWQPEQNDLLRPYVARYFPDAVAVAHRRGPAIADAAGRHAFPAHAIDTHTLTLGESCIEDDDPIPALRRRLADQLDDLARALKIRTATAAS